MRHHPPCAVSYYCIQFCSDLEIKARDHLVPPPLRSISASLAQERQEESRLDSCNQIQLLDHDRSSFQPYLDLFGRFSDCRLKQISLPGTTTTLTMRSALFHLIAANSILFQSTVAIPSPPGRLQPALTPNADSRPIWRSLTDKVIESVWGIDADKSEDFTRRRSQWQEPPRHTRSTQGEDIVLRFNVSNSDEASQLSQVAGYMFLDVWESRDDWVDIRMAKDTLPHVLKALPSSLRDAHTPLMLEKELAQAIYDTYPAPRKSHPPMPEQPSHRNTFTPTLGKPAASSGVENNVFFQDYQPFSVIRPWMRLLSSLFTSHVRLISVGTSFEGRDIPALRVGVHPTNDNEPSQPRKTILITGGLHAREWISTSTVNYIAYSLISSYGKSAEVTRMLETFDFVFVPTINPDGYVYTWETDRLWRKNRQSTPLRYCHGMDLDRSFGFEWDGDARPENPCSESYGGQTAFDATEALALANWARNETENNNVEFIGLLDLHSYSQQILYPYAFSCDATPPSLENLEELAAGLSKAIRVNSGHVFQARQACEGNVAFFETGGGSALDWFYHEMKIKFAYQVKLRDRGTYGFLLPREHIVPSGREMLEAVMYLGKYLLNEFEGAKVETPASTGLREEEVAKDETSGQGTKFFVEL